MEKSKKKFTKGMTIAEILIILLVLGIVAIAATPALHTNIKWHQYRTGVRKAKASLDHGLLRYAEDNGVQIYCGYWGQNPYKFKPECKSYDPNGNCLRWGRPNSDESLPADYSGRFDDCTYVYKSFLEKMSVVKKCNSNAYRNGCIPNYAGVDTLYEQKNELADDYEINRATANVAGFKKEQILSGKAFATADGFIFIPYGDFTAPIMLVDVNGYRGPNKWGYDLHGFIAKIPNINGNPSFVPYITSDTFIEKGGKTTYELLYKKMNESTM